MVSEIELSESLELIWTVVRGVGWRVKLTGERWIQQTNCSLVFWLLLPAWRSTETTNTASWHTSCEMNWGWRWDFGSIYCGLQQICDLNIKFKWQINSNLFLFDTWITNRMHYNIYYVFYSQYSHKHVSAGILAFYRVIFLQVYKHTNVVKCVTIIA